MAKYSQQDKDKVIKLHLENFNDEEIAKMTGLGYNFVMKTTTEYWEVKMKEKYVTPKPNKIKHEDKVLESVLNKFLERSEIGKQKYGVTLNREDLSRLEWLKHLQEELQDATLYVEKLMTEERLYTLNEVVQAVNNWSMEYVHQVYVKKFIETLKLK